MTLILSVVAFLLPLALFLPAYDGSFLPRQLILSAGTAGALAYHDVRVDPTTPLIYPGILFIFVSALFLFNSPTSSLLVLFETARWGMFLGLAVIGAALNDIRPILRASVAGAGLSAVLCIAQAAGWQGIPQTAPPAALFLNRNLLAEYLITVIPAVCWLAYRESKGYILANTLLVLALLLTNCRSAITGLVGSVGMIGLIVALRRIQLPKLLIISVWAVPVTLAGVLVLARKPLFDTALYERLHLWGCTLKMIAAYPLGVGPGGWTQTLPLFSPGATSEAFGGPRSPHCDILWLTAEYGIPGLLCLAWAAWIVCRTLWNRIHKDGEILTCAVTIGALFGASCFSFASQNAAAMFLPVLMAGYSTRIYQTDAMEYLEEKDHDVS